MVVLVVVVSTEQEPSGLADSSTLSSLAAPFTGARHIRS
jgi:hypothetical protein